LEKKGILTLICITITILLILIHNLIQLYFSNWKCGIWKR